MAWCPFPNKKPWASSVKWGGGAVLCTVRLPWVTDGFLAQMVPRELLVGGGSQKLCRSPWQGEHPSLDCPASLRLPRGFPSDSRFLRGCLKVQGLGDGQERSRGWTILRSIGGRGSGMVGGPGRGPLAVLASAGLFSLTGVREISPASEELRHLATLRLPQWHAQHVPGVPGPDHRRCCHPVL